jgi:Cdc6-like AAA superfamily ATPase
MNNQIIKKWALYYKNSIKDTDITEICSKPDEIEKLYSGGGTCSISDYQTGKIGDTKTVNILFAKYKELTKSNPDDEQELKSIPVIIIPHIARKKIVERITQDENDNFPFYILPLWIPVNLSLDGVLSPPDDERLPFINRDNLSPNSEDMIVIDTISNVDKILDENLDKLRQEDDKTWDKWLEFCDKLLRKDWIDIINNFNSTVLYSINKDNVLILPDDSNSNMTRNIISVYNDILSDNFEISPLFEKYCSEIETEKSDFIDENSQIEISKNYHTGHIAPYPLGYSQRESLIHCLNMNENEIMAINGPPGTGKTTLLHSLWTSLFINSALGSSNATNPPIILASSTNNQAILNILDSLEKDVVIERWLPEPIKRLGVFLGNKDIDKNKYHVHGRNGSIFDLIENNDYLNTAKKFYIQKFKESAYNKGFKDLDNINNIIKHINGLMLNLYADMKNEIDIAVTKTRNLINIEIEYKQIIDKYGDNLDNIDGFKNNLLDEIKILSEKKSAIDTEIKRLHDIYVKWNEYLSQEPFIYSILGWALKSKIEAKDRVFLLNNGINIDECGVKRKKIGIFLQNKAIFLSNGIDYLSYKSQFDYKENIYNQIDKDIKRRDELKLRFFDLSKELNLSNADILKINSLSDVLNPLIESLDVKIRLKLFNMAVHYWEGRYLIELENQLNDRIKRGGKTQDNRSKDGQIAMWRRFAMATPLFISTLHTAPGVFTYYEHSAANPNKKFYGLIDLLIIDEAGQVSTETAGAMFAFAKKAVIVGDTKQIQPVNNMPGYIDVSNAIAAEIVSNKQEYKDKYDKNIFIYNNSVMLKSHKKVGFNDDKYDQPGMFLSEHRRCFDPIIEYCNELAYNGKIKALKGTGETLYPYMGYAHISGESKKMGSSRYNIIEADSIAEWLYAENDKILKYYNKKHLSECVGIVTPFKAQEFTLKRALKTKGLLFSDEKKDNWKCGTVHSLQGAEKEIIIFSPVYTYKEKNGSFFFDATKDMLNVAVSRAKCSFLVFGDASIFNINKRNLPSGLLAKYIFANENNEISINHMK